MVTDIATAALELADLIDKATPGPWECFEYTLSGPVTITPEGRKCSEWVAEIDFDNREDCDAEGVSDRADADVAAILAARNDAPDMLRKLAERVRELEESIQNTVDDLQHQRVADWYPEGANNAALAMSESMRLIANSLVDILGSGEPK
jgi:hypothetical protein